MEPQDNNGAFSFKILIKNIMIIRMKYKEVCLIQPVYEDISALISSRWVTWPRSHWKNCSVYMEPQDKNVEFSNKMLIKKYENLSNQL